jgi:hypothetical protein
VEDFLLIQVEVLSFQLNFHIPLQVRANRSRWTRRRGSGQRHHDDVDFKLSF